MQTGSFQWMKSLNKSTILNMVRLNGPISRAEIAKMTKLTPPTVTNIVSELLESQLIIESDLGVSTGGRKPIMLKMNSTKFYMVGVCIQGKNIEVAIANLDGAIVHQFQRNISTIPTKEQFLEALKESVQKAINLAMAEQQSVLGIGIGVQGLVDPKNGELIYTSHLQLRQIPIKEVLEKEFKLPVEVENDVNAIALGENWFGQGRDTDKLVCIHLGHSIGAGMIFNNELYHGASYAVGEIGHMIIDVNGPPCSCGNRGCLDTFVSASAIVRRIKQEIMQGKVSIVLQKCNYDYEQITREMVYQAAQEGDELSIQILSETGRYLGIGLVNLIHLLNPCKIILHCDVLCSDKLIINTLQEVIDSLTFDTIASNVTIVHSNLGKQAPLIGAFTLALKKLFMPMTE